MIRNYYLFLILLFVVASCGGGGGGGGSVEPTVPSATITLSISDNQIYIGESVTLTWSTTNATSCSASGSWSGSKPLSGSESITPDTDGSKSFTLTCSNSAGTSTSRTVSTDVIGNSQGVVVGANYISSPTVILDINSNYQSDDGEPSTSADSSGVFELPNDPQDIISFGGSDNASGVDLTNLSLSHKASSSTSRVVSALTSLDYANTGSTDISTLLNLDSSIDIYSDDPVAGIGSSSDTNKYYEANAQIFVLAYSLQAFLNEINSSSVNTKTLFESLYASIQESFDSGNTNLSEFIETSDFIDAYIDSVLTSPASSDLKSIVKSVVEKISVRNNSSATFAITNFATGTFLNDVIALANGSADAVRIATYSSNLNSLIASDQNIDESILDQVITLTDDSVSIDEDNSLEFSPLANDVIDVGSDYYGLSVSISSPSNGSASLDETNNIVYTPNENYFGSDSLTYTVSVDGTSASANITIDVVSVNDPPTFKDFVSTSSIDENTLNVLSVTVEDVEDDVIGYSLSGNDAGKLSISTSGAITFKTNPDFENPTDTNSDNTYEITIEASDGTDTVTDDLVITILDVENEGNPIIEGLSSQSINENDSIGISFTVTDPQNDTITFSLSGVDKDLFTLTFDGLNASLTSSSKDYELPEDSDANNVYLVSVNFSDELNTTSQEVELSISNINDNDPVITSSSSFTVPENQQAVATLTATDADFDDLTFSISGGDSSDLEITDSGLLTLKTNPNFEVKNNYSFTASVTDGLYSASSTITVNISDVNEPPVWQNSLPTAFEFPENVTNVESIDSPEDVVDEDGDTLTFSLSGEDGNLFSVSGNIVSFLGAPDYEIPTDSNKDNIYKLNVVASDGSLTATSPEFSVTITNLNDNAPIFNDLVTEIDVTNGQTNVFDISTSDADGDDVSLSKSGTDSSLFTISDSGNLSFTSAPDFANPGDNNGDNVYKLTIAASDGSFTTNSDEISITVLEVNDPPVISDLQTSYSLEENISDIATFSVTDPENNQLEIGVSGEDSEGFSVVSNLLFYEGGLNFENPTDANADNAYTITIYADDGFNRTTQDVQITVSNVEEGPEFSISSNISLEENIKTVAQVDVSDPEGDAFFWEISGEDADLFEIPESNSLNGAYDQSGSLAFVSEGGDFESPTDANADNIYEITLIGTENKTLGLVTRLDLTITILDVKDSWNITGTIYSNPYSAIDGDVSNIVRYPPIDNSSSSVAQLIQNPTDVIGHIGDHVSSVVNLGDDGFCIEDPDNPGFCDFIDVDIDDDEDWYKFSGAPNLLLTLSIEGLIFEENGLGYCCTTDGIDADLLIYDEDGNLTDFSYTSSSTSIYKQIVLPETGNYYAVVRAIEGHTKYVLTLGSNVFGVNAFSPKDNFKLNRFISYVPFGKDFDKNSYEYPSFDKDSDLETKVISSIDSDFRGFREFDFDLETEYKSIFDYDYSSEKLENLDQAMYLMHWKLLQHYRNQYPDLNLELDVKVEPHFTPDPSFIYQWGLSQIGLDTVLQAIGAETKDIAVAVLDSGGPNFGSTASQSSAFLGGGYDFWDDDSDPTDSTAATDSHGTHVGSTIAALNDGNNINGYGIKVLPVRVMGPSGGYSSDTIQGMLYAAGLPNRSNSVYTGDTPIKVINMSLGSMGGSCSSSYAQVINEIYNMNISIVSSSGNSAQELPGVYGYPSSCPNVISVGALDYVRQRSYYSTYNDEVDIAAPGGDTSVDRNGDGYRDGILAFGSNEDLAFYQGTSMASPNAAGAIAILYSLVPNLTSFQVDGLLVDGHLTDDIGPAGRDDDYGWGALNIQKAVTRIISEEGLDFTYGTISPGIYNLGVEFNEFDLEVSKVGEGELLVNELSADIPSAVQISPNNVDSEGFGTYRVTIDRASLPDGLYQSKITVPFSNENSSSMVVTFQVGADRENISIPNVYATLIDESSEAVIWGYLDLTEGSVRFTASDINEGNYYWMFSTIVDSYIMDPGEFYNYYPDQSSTDDYFNLGESDIENTAVTLIVNKSNAPFSANNTGSVYPVTKIRHKVEDYNNKRRLRSE